MRNPVNLAEVGDEAPPAVSEASATQRGFLSIVQRHVKVLPPARRKRTPPKPAGRCHVNGHIGNLLELLHYPEYPTLLLGWPLGTKGTKRKWKHLTPASMTPDYVRKLAGKNIGVALGEKSSGLCSIDIDDEKFVRAFDAANPALKNTLRSHGRRGCNIWVRFTGAYPAAQNP